MDELVIRLTSALFYAKLEDKAELGNLGCKCLTILQEVFGTDLHSFTGTFSHLRMFHKINKPFL